MQKLLMVVVYCCAASAWADVPLFYEGFDYPDGAPLSPVPVANDPNTPENESTDQNNPLNQGQLNVASGKRWFSAGTGLRPIAVTGNEYDAATGLPTPTGNSIAMTGGTGANGTSSRIEIPEEAHTGDRTIYWSGFYRVVNIDTLAGAPGLNQNEGGVFIAGFNNTAGPQSGNLTAIGAFLAIKRASANPDSPLFEKYYAGTATNSQANDCGPVAGWRCANRHFADYDPAMDPLATPGADATDLPTVYKETSPLHATRPKFEAVPLSQDETVFFVGSYQYLPGAADNDVARLWINPDPATFGRSEADLEMAMDWNVQAMSDTVEIFQPPGDPPPPAQNYPANDMTNVVTFFLRNIGGAPADSRFDELRIGYSWASVTDPMEAPPAVPGDYNGNGTVDAADYVVWRKNLGTNFQLANEVANTTPGMVTDEDYAAWRERFGATSGSASAIGAAVPEPAMMLLVLFGAGLSAFRSRGASRQFSGRI
ncbi:MAG TPA: hypothetical protein VHK01_20060 [Lacipirellulaceae bacterium]|jgi:hypothetical protein|nr:hypothetical protein [Lacipirellulaceae bacterium]